MSRPLAAGLALTLAGAALAAPPPTPKAAPAWSVDRAASRLSFRVGAPPDGFDGVFRSWDADIAFDPDNLPASHLTVIVRTKSAVTGDPRRDQRLPDDDALGSSRFPRAAFVSRSISSEGPGRFLADGELTLKGAVRRVRVPFTFNRTGETLTLSGGLTLAPAIVAPGAPAASVTVRLTTKRRP